jgi:hypothetical protein
MKEISGGTDPIQAEHANRYVDELNNEQLSRKNDIMAGKGGLRSKITSLMGKAGPLKGFAERIALNQALSDIINDPKTTNRILSNDAAYTPGELDQFRGQHDEAYNKQLAGIDDQNNKANRFRANARNLEGDLASGKPIKKIDPDILNTIKNELASGGSLTEILKSMSSDPNLPEQFKHVDSAGPYPDKPAFDEAQLPKRTTPVVNNELIKKLRAGGTEFASGWGGRLGRLALLGAAGGGGASLIENGIRKAVGA